MALHSMVELRLPLSQGFTIALIGGIISPYGLYCTSQVFLYFLNFSTSLFHFFLFSVALMCQSCTPNDLTSANTRCIHLCLGLPLLFLRPSFHYIIAFIFVPASDLHMCPSHFILCALIIPTTVFPSISFSISWFILLLYELCSVFTVPSSILSILRSAIKS